MNITKRLLSILLFAAISVGAWALEQDSDGYYLIGSVQDWKDFAALVETTPAANAKMTADINLGDDQTVIGGAYNGSTLFYKGTFDGQGHTLTIAYNNTSGENFTCPFSLIDGATIKNLHLDGTVNSTYAYGGSVASILKGTNTIENVWNSITAVCTMGGWVQMGAFIGVLGSGSTTITDCLFTGSITHNGGYSGYFNGGYGPKPTVNNCLVLGTFSGDFGFNGNYNNCFCKHASTTGVTQTIDTNLSDGTITAALNADRTGDDAPWVQDPITNQPILKMFVSLKQDAEGYYLLGSVQDWDNFATLVNNGNTTANAKMTADIDLSTDVTMVGTKSIPYQGTFDGQGHKLTVNWSVNGGGDGVAPFRYVSGATIQKLHVDGNISATGSEQRGAASIVAFSIGSTTTTINECWGSVSLTCYDTMGGLFSVAFETSTVNITDCLFSGTINPTHSGQGFCAGFASQAMKNGSNVPTINITRGLFLGSYDGSIIYCYTFIRNDLPDEFGTHNITDCYYKDAYGTAQGTPVTSEELADGTTTSKLQNNRTEKVWVQDGDQPMLAVFVANNSGISTGFIPIENGKLKMENEANGWFSISGQKLNGKPATKGIYINNGRKVVVN